MKEESDFCLQIAVTIKLHKSYLFYFKFETSRIYKKPNYQIKKRFDN